MRAHSSGRVTSFVTMRVRQHKTWRVRSYIPPQPLDISMSTSKQQSHRPSIIGMWVGKSHNFHHWRPGRPATVAVSVKGPIRRQGPEQWDKLTPLTHMLCCEYRLILERAGYKNCVRGRSSCVCVQARYPCCVQWSMEYIQLHSLKQLFIK
jgi:hypothetical protein